MLNPFYSELAVGVERNARLHDYSLLICNCDGQVQRCVNNIDLLEGKRIDGFILQPPETINAIPEQLHALQEKLNSCDTPSCDSLIRAIHDVYHDYIAADHQLGGSLATDYLIRLGHTRIGCITGSLTDYGSKHRLAGYKEVLSSHGIAFDPSLIYEGLYLIETGYQGALELSSRMSLLFLHSAIRLRLVYSVLLLNAASRFRMIWSLVGYDDSSIAHLCSVPLTTIHQPDRAARTTGM